MNNMIETWLQQQGVEATYLPMMNLFIGCLLIIIISMLSYYIERYQLLKSITLIITKTQNTWDDLFLEHNVFTRAMQIIPFIVILLPSILFTGLLTSGLFLRYPFLDVFIMIFYMLQLPMANLLLLLLYLILVLLYLSNKHFYHRN